MSYQNFISPSNGRLNRSLSGSSLPLCSLYSGDHSAQQALYMGCPSIYNQVSFSPSYEIGRQVNIPSSSSLISFQPMPTPTRTCPPPPRIMYPSSNYSQGNPGFYYDLMQNNHQISSQTTMLQTPMLEHIPTPIHTPTYLPTPLHTNLLLIILSLPVPVFRLCIFLQTLQFILETHHH
jgi:hypothetical protein